MQEATNIERPERRLCSRFPIKLVTRFFNFNTNKTGSGRTFDISSDGLGLTLEAVSLGIGDCLDMWLDLPDGSSPVYTKGKVSWNQILAGNRQRVGVDLLETDRLKPVSIILKTIQVNIQSR